MPQQTAMHFWEIAAMITVQTVLSLLLFSAAIGILVFMVRKPLRKYKRFDLAVFDLLQHSVSARKSRLMLFITFLGKHQFLIPANLLLIFYFIFIRHQNWFSIRVLTIALSSLVLMILLKMLFQRKRPLSPLLTAARGLSFPSGHAIMAVSFYGLLLYIILHAANAGWIKVTATILLVILIFLIGYSRVYLRVHYASDVIAGFIVGILWLAISLFVLDRVEEYATPAINEVRTPAVVVISDHARVETKQRRS
jgi:undecaprenyl-diphosphatase